MAESKAKKAGGPKGRVIKYLGSLDALDMRPALGLVGDESEEARKFVFYRVGSRVDPDAGARQRHEGVEMTDEQALLLVTHPDIVGLFVDATPDADPLAGALAEVDAPPPVAPGGDTRTGYETAPAEPV